MTKIEDLDLTGCLLQDNNNYKFVILSKRKHKPWGETYEKLYLNAKFHPRRVFQSYRFINECYLGGRLKLLHTNKLVKLLYGD